jgi:proteic killer suppression protein
MEVRFKDRGLERLNSDARTGAEYPAGVVKAFRKRIQVIRAAPNEQVFYSLKSLHYEKLKGKRDHQHSMRLNDQYRLILEYDSQSETRVAVICSIEDYH